MRNWILLSAAIVLLPALPAGAEPYSPPGRTERLTADGAQLDGWVFSEPPGVSRDGRFVSFTTWASNLVPGDTNELGDVFVLDRASGEVERVSVSTSGEQGVGTSSESSMSADGRFVAFSSWAENLDPRDGNGTYDVFVHDRQTGRTEMVSIADDGTLGNFGAEQPAISADGRFVAFTWHARNLPGDANNAGDVYVHDRVEGTTTLASLAHDGSRSNGQSNFPSITADGRTIAFASEATNLVPGDLNWVVERRHGWDVFVRDLVDGTIRRVNVTNDGGGSNLRTMIPSISADGSAVAFLSGASNLVPNDLNRAFDIFVHDVGAGVTERLSVTNEGVEGDYGSLSNFYGMGLTLSEDGRFVAFGTSQALADDDAGGGVDVYVHDRVAKTNERISIPLEVPPGGGGGGGNYPAISGDGTTVAFTSMSTALSEGDVPETVDLFVRNRGPVLGAGEAHVGQDGDGLEVGGWARFGGRVLSEATDRTDDGGALAARAGGELTGAQVVVRPERDDVLLRWTVTGFPGYRSPEPVGGYYTSGGMLVCPDCSPPSAGGAPEVVFGADLVVDGERFEVRGTRLGAEGDPTTARFGLHRCAPACEEVSALRGGYGTAGEEVRASVPLAVLGDPAEVASARMFTLAGRPDHGAFTPLDEVALPGFEVPVATIDVGVAPVGTPSEQVGFDTPAELGAGSFRARIPSGASSGDVWLRTCLGSECVRQRVG